MKQLLIGCVLVCGFIAGCKAARGEMLGLQAGIVNDRSNRQYVTREEFNAWRAHLATLQTKDDIGETSTTKPSPPAETTSNTSAVLAKLHDLSELYESSEGTNKEKLAAVKDELRNGLVPWLIGAVLAAIGITGWQATLASRATQAGIERLAARIKD